MSALARAHRPGSCASAGRRRAPPPARWIVCAALSAERSRAVLGDDASSSATAQRKRKIPPRRSQVAPVVETRQGVAPPAGLTLIREVDQRRPSPEGHRLAKDPRSHTRVPALKSLTTRLVPSFEPVAVELVGSKIDAIAARLSKDRLRPKCLPKARRCSPESPYPDALGRCSGHRASIKRSRETSRFGSSRRSASTARCLAPPRPTRLSPSATSSGPRTR